MMTSRSKVEMLKRKQTKKQDRAAAMPLSQIIKELNKENAPPDGWRPEDKVTSNKQQATSNKPQASSNKRLTKQDYRII